MRRFVFKLEKVLELRSYKERIAEAKLAEKSGMCAKIQMSLDDNAHATFEARRDRFRPGGGASDYRASELYAMRLSQEREKLMKAMALAEAEREAARLAYVEASKSKKLVSKLREREETEYYKTVSREETKTMDDLASGSRMRADAERSVRGA